MREKIYTHPEEVGDPPSYNGQEYNEFSSLEKEWENKLKEFCFAHGKGKYRGEEFSYPVGDGAARYFVVSISPLALVHIPTGDAWSIPLVVERGLTGAYVKQTIDNDKELVSIFSRRES